MDGRRAGQNGATGKWCNFAFETDGAPKKLLALSAKAGIPKERAVLSFVFAQKMTSKKDCPVKPGNDSALSHSRAPMRESFDGRLRIASDIIRVPAAEPGQKSRIGHYACSEKGLVLALSSGGRRVYSGDLLELDEKDSRAKRGNDKAARDAKSGALIVEI